jgi:hypothetical protein
LHRFAWELQSRLDSLSELVDRRALAPLRSTQCIVATIDIALRESGRMGTRRAGPVGHRDSRCPNVSGSLGGSGRPGTSRVSS